MSSADFEGGHEAPLVRVPPPGPVSRACAARLAAVECPAFDARRVARAEASGADQSPIVYASGCGANVVDVDGNRYVDLVAGFGALALGHRAPAIEAAVHAQSAKLGLALGDVYGSDVKLELLERLARLYPEPGARVLLGITGADAVTAALKTAVLATGRAGVVAFRGSYHGLSHGPLAACGLSDAFRAPFAEQLGNHVSFAPYPGTHDELEASLAAVKRIVDDGNVGAILVEPILGRGGCVVPPVGFLPALRRICNDAGALLIADEIWTGFGRSGAWVASVEGGVVPDLVCLGKAMGGGVPVSACVGSAKAMAAWGGHGGTALHTATHFGSPVACAAALATMRELERANLVARAGAVGARFVASLERATAGIPSVRDVRGRGLMIGVELDGGAARALAVTRGLLARGYLALTGGVAGNVMTLTPPLTIDEPLLDAFAVALAEAVREAHS